MTTLLTNTLLPNQPRPDSPALIRTEALRAVATQALVDRISARISASVEEIAPFATVEAALERIATRFLAGRRVVLAQPTGDALAARAWSAAAAATVASAPTGATTLDVLVSAARDADVVVLSSPLLSASPSALGLPPTLSPRELLLLRSRAPRPLIVLDLLEEEYARTPLTQPALLLPGTLILRGFGRAWREVGATAIAPLAFVAGPRDLVSSLDAPLLDPRLAEAACADLDRPSIDRTVRERVAAAGVAVA